MVLLTVIGSVRNEILFVDIESKDMLSGSVCKFHDFSQPWFHQWAHALDHPVILHRKLWEWCIQSEILFTRKKLQPGMRGLGFAVGAEPLPSLFAARGVHIDATDINAAEAGAWADTGQHAAGLDDIFKPTLIDRQRFDQQVRFFSADMRKLEGLVENSYDFLWSSCALEHLGTLQAGLDFICKSMNLLKVGGVACHTTEFNISSFDETIEEGDNVIYRVQDLERLSCKLRSQFCMMERMDYNPGYAPEDVRYDVAPWGSRGHPHIKLQLDNFICTSAVIVCHRLA